jgi:hypothetical protein
MAIKSDIDLSSINTEKVNGKKLAKIIQNWYRDQAAAINNLSTSLGDLQAFDTNADALAAGLQPGDFFHTSGDPAHLCVVIDS